MKQALVVPLLKKPTLDREILKNYRPVSNLSFLSKVLERVVAARLNAYMKANNLHDMLQSAYKSGHSTETALLKIQCYLRSMVDNHGAAILVLLDLSAAFDTVDHDILLNRMRHTLGITGTALKWFRSYLSGRVQRVVINGQKSITKPLNCGVPQGSVLGPLLFLIYILPLSELFRESVIHHHGFADDKQVYMALQWKSFHLQNQLHELEHKLSGINTWLHNNMLIANPDKYDVMVVGTKQTLDNLDIRSIEVAGITLTFSSVPIRNLGVLFDPLLSMESHVKSVIRSTSFHLRSIGIVRRQLTAESAKLLTQSIVLSRLDYCNSCLAGVSEAALDRLQLVQNRAARIVTRTKMSDHITPVLDSLHWLPVRQRIVYKLLLLAFKCFHGLAPQYLNDLVQHYSPPRSLRSESKYLLSTNRYRLETFGGRSFKCYVPALWNSLPQSLCEVDSVETFKKNLKTFLFKKHFSV